MRVRLSAHLGLLAASLALTLSSGAAAFDEAAAMATVKKNECFKCHAVDKTKKAPSYHKIASRYRGLATAEVDLFKHLTTSPEVKLEDGSREEHKALDPKDAANIKNLIQWILSL